MAVNPPLVQGATGYHDLTEQISSIVEGDVFKTPHEVLDHAGHHQLGHWCCCCACWPTWSSTGIGVWGNNRPIGWAWDITNFVFWIGIGHAGTLISAILFLFRQKWRTSINRSAEAMTLFAVMCAGIFPLFHTGRPWRAYWLFPVPNTDLNMWQNFRSPLIWDVFAVIDLFDGFAAVLVHGPGSRSGDHARPRDHQNPAVGLRRSEPGLARFGPALEQLRSRVPDSGGHLDAAGASASTPSSASTSRRR